MFRKTNQIFIYALASTTGLEIVLSSAFGLFMVACGPSHRINSESRFTIDSGEIELQAPQFRHKLSGKQSHVKT